MSKSASFPAVDVRTHQRRPRRRGGERITPARSARRDHRLGDGRHRRRRRSASCCC
ncbi:MAG: hypothetical protein MZW92_75230 [Comamonadaceae bacterium]|nr:hypothetical protein [Comamonadaceae bacterium]